MSKKELNNSRKITKVSLVIYSSIMFALAIVFLTLGYCLKHMQYMWGYLLCLGPSLIFVFATIYLSIFLHNKTDISRSRLTALYIIFYFLKYALIIGIPIIGIWKKDIFDKWAMLSTTLIAPILVLVTKIVFANIVSKNSKK